MLKKSFLLLVSMIILCCCAMVGCGTEEDFNLKGNSLFGDTINLGLGNYTTLDAIGLDSKGKLDVEWSSGNSGIATIDETGRINGIKEGKTTITAKNKGNEHTVNIIVRFVYYKIEYAEAGSSTQYNVAQNVIDEEKNELKTYWEPMAEAKDEDKYIILTLDGDSKKVGGGIVTFLDNDIMNIALSYEVYISDSITFENGTLIASISGNEEYESKFEYTGNIIGKYIKIIFTELSIEGGSYPKVQDIKLAFN